MPAPEVVGPGHAEVWRLDHSQLCATSKTAERSHRRVTIEDDHVGVGGSGGRRDGHVSFGDDDDGAAEDVAAMQTQSSTFKTVKSVRMVR
jgi:hypothetical protein